MKKLMIVAMMMSGVIMAGGGCDAGAAWYRAETAVEEAKYRLRNAQQAYQASRFELERANTSWSILQQTSQKTAQQIAQQDALFNASVAWSCQTNRCAVAVRNAEDNLAEAQERQREAYLL